MKTIKLMRDYNTSPLWKAGGEWGDVGQIESVELPLFDALKSGLDAWQKVKDDYFAVMENIPGGGWSHYTLEEVQNLF